jgi:NitT/TauT family transport system substrate-binding protein
MRRLTFLLLLFFSVPASAEVNRLRIGAQFGLGYLPLYILRDADLLDAALKQAGLPPIEVEIHNFAGGPEIADGLLSNTLDIGSGGITAMMISWDKTRNSGPRAMRGIAALSAMPYELLTDDPALHTLADLTAKDRIGLPAVKISVPAVMLQVAAERLFGAGHEQKFDPITLSLAQPDGATALLAGSGVVDGYTFAAPFIQQLQDKPRIHEIWSSNDVFGTPTTSLAVWTTAGIRQDNPRTYNAFLVALHAAMKFIAAHPDQAARIYLQAEHSTLLPKLIEDCLKDPSMTFNTAPSNTMALSDFMARTGRLKQRAATWQDLFFPDIAGEKGS